MQVSFILRSSSWLLACACALGCSSVLGINDARCDPNLPACQTSTNLCTSYCNQVMASCVRDLAQYTSLRNCEAVCSRLPAGAVGDDKVNTVQCRIKQAQLAADLSQPDKVIACPGAGPGGNGLCGGNCEGACTIITESCTDNNLEYPDLGSCETECQGITDQNTFNATMTSMSEGNTVQCRLWHASAAAEAAVPHCNHAAGASPCSD